MTESPEAPFAPTYEVIKARVEQHLIWAEQYVARFNDGNGKTIPLRVNPRALFLAIKSAYDDIYRYKAYHLNDPRNKLSNAVKRAAYVCKWVNKLKPIQPAVQPDCPTAENYDDITSELVNGAFSLALARTYIIPESGKIFYYSKHYMQEFQYDLLYRNLGDDGLLHIFQNIFYATGLGRAGVLDIIGDFPKK